VRQFFLGAPIWELNEIYIKLKIILLRTRWYRVACKKWSRIRVARLWKL